MGATHEDYSRGHEIKTSSNRSFGLIVGGILTALALLRTLRFGQVGPGIVLFVIGLPLCLLAVVRPSLLAPLNQLWGALGLLLAKVTNPVIMGIVFYGVCTPLGIFMRLAGKDPLRLKVQQALPSYWIQRQPPGPDPKTMVHQF